MAKYRQIHIAFWQGGFVEEGGFSPKNDKKISTAKCLFFM